MNCEYTNPVKGTYLQEGAAYLVPLGVEELGPGIHEGWRTVRMAGVGTLRTNRDIILYFPRIRLVINPWSDGKGSCPIRSRHLDSNGEVQ